MGPRKLISKAQISVICASVREKKSNQDTAVNTGKGLRIVQCWTKIDRVHETYRRGLARVGRPRVPRRAEPTLPVRMEPGRETSRQHPALEWTASSTPESARPPTSGRSSVGEFTLQLVSLLDLPGEP
ncbi:hypothetical protein E2C01_044371 [Portunus trituberculatus]|uniref:Uncharacterized protein n=1 Tax=Portunus trituberculatus TaxID=210409 RepID=A0A5B7FVF9_PORTR|nr:hypothetical protein [Portunus trituberculatus]